MNKTRLTIVTLMALALLGTAAGADAEQLKGRPRVTSGDSMIIARTEVRLSGIDAPEPDQYCENEFGRPYQCGLQALDALKAMVGRNDVVCVTESLDEDGRPAGTCYSGDMNLNTRMVRTGWAVARPKERPDYVPLEAMAKREKAGIWALKFEDPAVWRQQYQ